MAQEGFDPEARDVRGFCPECGGDRRSTVYGHGINKWEEERGLIWGQEVYRVLQCDGCGTFYFQKQSIFSEDIHQYYDDEGDEAVDYNVRTETWPPPKKHSIPDWVDGLYGHDRLVHKLLLDVYKCVDHDLGIFAAIGVRTVFDRAAESLGVNSKLPFVKKLDQLSEKSFITKKEAEFLATLVNAGSAAAHRGWEPTEKELRDLLLLLESFLLKSFLLESQIKNVAERIPPR
jgi:hypothetical protein